MNDYFAGKLAGERQADYLREVAHDQLLAQVHRAEADAQALAAGHSTVAPPMHHRWRHRLGQLALTRVRAHGHRS